MFPFLPTTLEEMRQKGWESLDVILVTGDAYVDHPSFGAAMIGRYLESQGIKVGIIAQPDWRCADDIVALGKPNLFFGVTAGNLDSMVANYSPEKKSRKRDEYTENGVSGCRPDRATIVYTNLIKSRFPGVPVILGGIEASLRRLAHYDYWSNGIRRSLLFDSRADLIVYGMGEKAIGEVVQRMRHGAALGGIPNTAYVAEDSYDEQCLELPSYEQVKSDKMLYATSVKLYYHESVKKHPRPIIQRCQNKVVVVEPPGVLEGGALDHLYVLPFVREAHPRYKAPIPAFSFVKHSVVSHRGCYGGCSFCTLNLHQGKYIQTRSSDSILNEIKDRIIPMRDFKGNILDIGGPSANMYGSRCTSKTGCSRPSCLVPARCSNLRTDEKVQLDLWEKVRRLKGVKRLFINSGVRVDLALDCPEYMDALIREHVSGQLSIAPEHMSPSVLSLMNKPAYSLYEKFYHTFNKISAVMGKKQYIIPYFIAAHPGSTLMDMYDMAVYMKKHHIRPEQVQTFTPIPMTLSACMYYTGINPMSGEKIHVPVGEERLLQRALLQAYLPQNAALVKRALKLLGKKSL